MPLPCDGVRSVTKTRRSPESRPGNARRSGSRVGLGLDSRGEFARTLRVL